MLGEAHFLRALAYHDLVKFWGRVPIRLTPIASIEDAADITRASLDEVYAQIKSDLDLAEGLMSSQTESRAGSIGGVRAIRTRVLLYEASPGPTGRATGATGGWQAALDEADRVLAMGYELADNYADLFHAVGANTSEDIFRVRFIAEDAFWAGYYFHTKPLGGRFEVGPTAGIDAAYEDGDVRHTWSLKIDPNSQTLYISKFPTPIGAEHPHVIRLAEIILIQAEALANLNRLGEAVDAYNRLRERARLPLHVLGVDVTDQASVIAAIRRERRVELAFEGDRWPDLVRSNRAVTVMALSDRPGQVLYPIPQSEIDVSRREDGTPRLEQNPGY
jgi:hypothetical protein